MNLEEVKSKILEFDRAPGWYQKIDLGNGLVTKTRSVFGEELDHPRKRWACIESAVPDLKGKSVLDLGCNAGFISFEAKRRGASYVCGVDLKKEFIDQAKFCNEVIGAGVDFRVMNIEEIKTLGQKFDVVFFVGLLYHCWNITSALEQVAGIAKEVVICESAIHEDRSKIPLVRFVNSRKYGGPNAKQNSLHQLPGHWHPNMAAMREFFYKFGFKDVRDVFKKQGRGAVIAYR